MTDAKKCSRCGQPISGQPPVCPQCGPVRRRVRYFGDYFLIGQIGEGGMGVAYRARQVSLNRPVALKLIKGEHLASDAARARFRVEAEATARLDHPHVVPIYEVGEHEGQPYLCMKLIEGSRRLLDFKVPNSGPAGEALRTQRQVATLMAQGAQAVHHAHQRGVLHRDLSPGNILVDEEGAAHVTDFGLAKLLDRAQELTASLVALGTVQYMAPEVEEGGARSATVATDVYSLGAMLYHLLAGRPVFAGETGEVRRQIREAEPVPVREVNPLVAADLETICLKCLEKEPKRRYPTAQTLAEELGRWLRGEPIQARPIRVWERTVKWYRRKPAVAWLATAAVVALMVGSGATYLQSRATARANVALRETTLLQRIQLAEADHDAGRTDFQLDGLAAVLRKQPDNRLAAQRLLTALSECNVLLPQCGNLFHPSPVQFAEFSHDGSKLVTADHVTVRIWDPKTCVPLSPPMFHVTKPLCARLSPDGRFLVTVCEGELPQLWDARTGQRLRAVGEDVSRQTLGGSAIGSALGRLLTGKSAAEGVAATPDAHFNQDGSVLGTLNSAGVIGLYRCGAEVSFTMRINPATPVKHIRFAPADSTLVGVCTDRTVLRWNPVDGKQVGAAQQLSAEPSYAEFSNDGSRLLTLVSNHVQVLDLRRGMLLSITNASIGQPGVTRFSPDGQRVAVASMTYWGRGGKAWILDTTTGQVLCGPLEHHGTVESLNFSPDGLILATGTDDFMVRLWDAHDGRPLTEPAFQGSAVTDVQFSLDGRTLCATTEGMVALLWRVDLSRPVSDALPAQSGAGAIAFATDDTRLLTAGADGVARAWDWRRGVCVNALTNETYLVGIAASSDGRTATITTGSGTLRWWDWTDGLVLAECSIGNPAQRWPTRFDATGERLLAVGNGQVQLRQARPGLPVIWSSEAMALGQHTVFAAEFGPTSHRVITAGVDGEARVWEASSGRVQLTLKRPQEISSNLVQALEATLESGGSPASNLVSQITARAVAAFGLVNAPGLFWAGFSPDGEVIATAPADGTVDLWSAGGRRLDRLVGHKKPVLHGCFSPDGRRLATASGDNTVRVWEIPEGKAVGVLRGHQGQCVVVRYSPDGRRLVTCAFDGTARMWDAHTLQPLIDPLRHGGDVRDAAFTRDGQVLATVSKESRIRMWELPDPAEPLPTALVDFVRALAAVESVRGFGDIESSGELHRARTNLTSLQGDAFFARWTRWWLDRSATNTITFFSQITRGEYVNRLAQSGDIRDVKRAVLLDPTNAVALARFSLMTANESATANPRRKGEARLYFERALKFSLEPSLAEETRKHLGERGVDLPAPNP